MTLSETLIAALDENAFPIPNYPTGIGIARRRVIDVHDAIASILCFVFDSSFVAVGSAVFDDRVTIFISSSATLFGGVEEYFHKVCNILRDIQQEVVRRYNSDGDNSDLIKLLSELQRLVYGRPREKFLGQFPKESLGLSRFFDEVLKDGSEYVSGEPREHNRYILDEELLLIMSLHNIYLTAEAFNSLEEEESLDEVSLNVAFASIVFACRDVFSDVSDSSFLRRCDHIVAALNENTPSQKSSVFCRFREKLAALEKAFDTLVSLTWLRHMDHLFRYEYAIEIIDQPKLHLHYNFADDSGFRDIFTGREPTTHDAFLVEYSRRNGHFEQFDQDVPLHCECALLAYFVDKNIPAYGYIGVPEPPCLGCALYFHAYNSVAAQQGLCQFFTRGENSKGHHPWVKPQFSDRNLDEQVEHSLVQLSSSKFFDVLKAALQQGLSNVEPDGDGESTSDCEPSGNGETTSDCEANGNGETTSDRKPSGHSEFTSDWLG